MDPTLEGERALHWFEVTASPELIWTAMMCLSLSTALACLSGAESCKLDLVAKEVRW